MATLKIVTLQESNFRDPVATLRALCDEIEQGTYGRVSGIALVMLSQNKGLEVFSMGPDSDAGSASLLLQAGNSNLVQAVADVNEIYRDE